MKQYIVIIDYNGYSFISGSEDNMADAENKAAFSLASQLLRYHKKGAKPKAIIAQIKSILE